MKNNLYGLIVLILLVGFLATPINRVSAESSSLVLDTRTEVALRAASLATETMTGVYSWKDYRSCSSFVSTYLKQLAFPVDGMKGQYEYYDDPFPWSGTIEQTDWIRRNASEYVQDAPLIDFLEGKLWDQIKPGDIIYLQTAIGHNGYNTYYHVVVLVGYHEDGSPQFAEISPGSSASFERSFEEMTSFYQKDMKGQWDVEPYQTNPTVVPGPLMVTWFDPLAYLNSGLWLKSGVVVPNSEILSDNFSTVITVNLYDGTTAIFEKTPEMTSGWNQVTIDGKKEFYAVIGRFLPTNNTIGNTFFQSHENEIYDSDFGVYISEDGVYQNTWTPQMIARVTTFSYISGFGGLDGSTDTAIMTPLVYDSNGDAVDATFHSSFTIHRIPDVENQDMLLRTDLLEAANNLDGDNYGPIPVPKGNLSSGCVNYDVQTWAILKEYLSGELDGGVGVVLSYPGFDQDILPNFDLFSSPFLGEIFSEWCPLSGEIKCDPYDRRDYRDTYLDD
ncbi:MAG TPA: amidase domain-containing protein [Candidatus Woesebacteria bacterium]|nr:amidase domain-containing protein [Candidatus Woesebacteria bacterium]